MLTATSRIDAMIQTYALLNSRFHKDAAKINQLRSQYVNSEKAREELALYGGITVGMPSIEEMEELAEFVDECS